MLEFATIPDLLRLVVLPVFGVLAWRDVQTRRVPNRVWLPLLVLAVVLLAWDSYRTVTGDVQQFRRQRFFLQVTISILVLVPLSYGFWILGGFGAADTKAFMVLAVLLPTFPTYELWRFGVEGTFATLPAIESNVGVFSLTVLSNTVLAGVVYPLGLALKNALSGQFSPGMFVGKQIPTDEATTEYGSILAIPDRRIRDDLSVSGLKTYFYWRGLDLDALRMYLQWRGRSLEELRDRPDTYRDPASLPETPNPPGDGSIPTAEDTVAPDGGAPDGAVGQGETEAGESAATDDEQAAPEDPWGAERFLDDIDGDAYGTTPERLREGLETLTRDETVWISPGIPFLVPTFFGLVIAFTYGDVLFALLELVGVV